MEKRHKTERKEKDNKNVLILSSSPRKGGNSDLLCDQFAKGAIDAGHQVEKIYLNDMKINFFTNDDYNDMTGLANGDDDANEIVGKMVSADVIVMATPVYFYAMCGQMKTMIDRTYERYNEISSKEFYYIITAADKDKETLQVTVEEFRGFLDCIPDPVERGIIYGTGVWEKGSIKDLPVMNEAYEMGKGV
ncbi:MAG: flavodoxin family protein [Bacteroidales bacterium]|nr:flavodoxin family protein [Bacteroidales bacterium]